METKSDHYNNSNTKFNIVSDLFLALRMLLNRKHLLLALLALHCVLLASMGGLARAEEDEVEEEDEEGVVEEEGGQPDTASDSTEEAGDKTTSPDADTTILFTRPPGTTSLGTVLASSPGLISFFWHILPNLLRATKLN